MGIVISYLSSTLKKTWNIIMVLQLSLLSNSNVNSSSELVLLIFLILGLIFLFPYLSSNLCFNDKHGELSLAGWWATFTPDICDLCPE